MAMANIANVIERLRANEEEFKQLILTADEVGIPVAGNNEDGSATVIDSHRATKGNITQLIDAIQSNSTVHSVFLDHFFVINLEADDLCLLFQALGSLPKLGQFSALSRQAEGWSIPLQAIATFLHRARMLTSFRMTSIGLEGTRTEFESFTKAVQSQAFLKEFCLRGACIVDEQIPLDQLLRALSAVPLLEKIELTAMDLHQDLGGKWPNSPSSALRFCYSSSLKSLELGGWALDDELVIKMATALETNNSLRSLVMLHSHITDKACAALAKTLAVNQTIERLDLSYNCISDLGCIALANSLIYNNSLKEIGLFGNTQVNSRAIFLRIIQNSNMTLEDLLLDSEWDAEINFYLNLNRIGRRCLLRNEKVSRGAWVETLSEVQGEKQSVCDSPQDTLSNLFYFVLAKPHFVSPTATSVKT